MTTTCSESYYYVVLLHQLFWYTFHIWWL